ncbi:hypothetical protein Taro_039384 [Colocasia esculenta]|uniref:Uncharacterized protein n=1 Tax=Colocasia esculenta TaxID=4460 RepID=A0A843WRE9_COLES|nr:hypothetical protein [Colocasia esculenta]
MDPSPWDPCVVDSASKLLKDLRLAGMDRHGKALNMDTMDIDLLTEVPDTPDRLAMMCPQEESSEGAERKMHYRSQSGHLGKGTRIGCSDASDNDSLFRKARLASLISRAQDVELAIRAQGANLGREKDICQSHGLSSYSEDGIEGDKGNEYDKKLPLGIYPSRYGDNRRKMGQDFHDKNEERCDDHLNAMVSSTNGPCRRTHNGIVNSLELSDRVCRTSRVTDVDVTSVGWKHCSKGSLMESSCNGKETGLSNDSQGTARNLELRPSLSHAYPRTTERRRLVRNGCISPSNIAKNKSPSLNRESISSYSRLDAHDKGKGVDLSNGLQNKGEKMPLRPYQFDIPRRNTGQRRLGYLSIYSPNKSVVRLLYSDPREREGVPGQKGDREGLAAVGKGNRETERGRRRGSRRGGVDRGRRGGEGGQERRNWGLGRKKRRRVSGKKVEENGEGF